ncbi:hypothetical protein ACH49O_30350 [Streptomyces coeruleorubidus]|uniref:hypothetical protein n=1 Tax=Streptomyces coeruleorubidus TaxID=116188 RepID=UPI0033DE4E96
MRWGRTERFDKVDRGRILISLDARLDFAGPSDAAITRTSAAARRASSPDQSQ